MSWLQIELGATPANLAGVETALETAGAVAVTLISAADEPVLEPSPGETPLWDSVTVRALLPLDVDVGALRQALQAVQAGAIDQVDFVAAQDWSDAARSFAVDRIFADRLHLMPKPEGGPEHSTNGPVRLYLEPGLAFGSGSHPTTSLCLAWLAANVEPGMRVLDFGCGSGVLGIAAALLGASVVAVDHDPQAVMATRDNAAYNGLQGQQLVAMDLQTWEAGQEHRLFDVVVANILAGPLCNLAGVFEQTAAAGAAIVLSGILETQADSVVRAYKETKFNPPQLEAGWVLLTGVKA